jgi:hypothetical protein
MNVTEPIAGRNRRARCWRDDRTGPMQAVSRPISKERVHFEARPAKRLPREVKAFLKRFNRPPDTNPVLKAALACEAGHLFSRYGLTAARLHYAREVCTKAMIVWTK